MKLPVGKGSMDDRIDYAIQQTKRRMAAPYDENEEEDETLDIIQENDMDDIE
jgi:hypothetical protein